MISGYLILIIIIISILFIGSVTVGIFLFRKIYKLKKTIKSYKKNNDKLRDNINKIENLKRISDEKRDRIHGLNNDDNFKNSLDVMSDLSTQK